MDQDGYNLQAPLAIQKNNNKPHLQLKSPELESIDRVGEKFEVSSVSMAQTLHCNTPYVRVR